KWYVYDNDCGTVDSCEQTITVTANQNPLIQCPADIIVSTDAGICGAVVNYDILWSYNCPGHTLTQTSGLPSGAIFPVDTTTNTFEVTDGIITVSCSFDVIVTDNEVSNVTCPDNMNIPNDPGTCQAFVNVPVFNSPDCITVNGFTGYYAPGNWNIYNNNGGDGTVNFAAPSSLTLVSGNNGLENETHCEILIPCDGELVFSWEYNTVDDGPEYDPFGYYLNGFFYQLTDNGGDQYQSGTENITVNATDIFSFCAYTEDGVAGSATTISYDFSAPGPAGGGIASDNCGIDTIYNDLTGTADASGIYPVGTTTLIWTVVDINGNSATCTQDITVTDTQLPTFTCAPDVTAPNDPGVCEAFVTVLSPTDTADNCGIASMVNNYTGTSDASGIYPVGTTVLTWIVTDVNGNTSFCNQNITVTDSEFPVINCPGDTTLFNDAGICGAYVTYSTPTATDNCPFVFVNPIVNGSFETGDYTGWTLYSLDGAYGTWGIGYNGQTLFYEDSLYDYDDMTWEYQPSDGLPYTFAPTDGNYMAVFLQNGGTFHRMFQDIALPAGTENLSVDMQYANWAFDFDPSQQLAINLRDPLSDALLTQLFVTNPGDPAFLAMTNFNFDISAYAGQNVRLEIIEANFNNWYFDVLFDNVKITGTATGVPQQISGLPSGSFFPIGVTTNTYQITDGAGNISTCSFDVEVTDVEAPWIECPFEPAGILRPADSGYCTAYIDVPLPIYGDNCAIDSVVNDFNFTDNASGNYPVGITTVTWTVYDVNGNTNTCYDFVNVIDNQPPVTVTQDITINLNANGFVSIVPADVDGGSFDNCAIIDMTLSQTLFTCANIGANTVTLTVYDANGNLSSGSAVVTVVDDIPPVVFCSPAAIQLDASGNVTLLPDEVFSGATDACGIDTMYVSPNTFTCVEVGDNTVTLTVEDVNGNAATCITTVTVMDNVPPVAVCQDIVVQLDASGNASIIPSQIDNGSSDACGVDYMIVYPDMFTCDNVGGNLVTLTVVDVNNNQSTCTATVTVEDIIPPAALCNNLLVYLDENGIASILPSDIDNGSNDACGIASLSVSPETFGCSDISTTPADLFISEYIEGSSNNKAIELFNPTTSPIDLGTGYKIKMYMNGNPSAGVNINLTGVINPLETFVIAHSSANASILSIANMTNGTGWFNVDDAVVLEDPAGNILDVIGSIGFDPGSEWSVAGNSTADNTIVRAPFITQGLTVNPPTTFPTLGTEWLPQLPQNNISNLGIHSINLGVPVTLTVTDVNGNTSSCSANVVVADNIPPVALCQNITVQLDSTGNASIIPADVDGGSADACGIDTITVVPDAFTCANVGENIVILTVTDVNGNVSSCAATVTVEDNVPPVALCQDIDLYLDASGNASIIPDDVDGGSSDACGIDNMSVIPNTFTCAEVGDNIVTLEVTDVNGNMSSCTATVTVMDTVPPVALCQNINLQLDEFGNASITTDDIDDGSNDACGIANMSLDVYDFSCTDVGDNSVVLTVTDVNGNIATCNANVFVQDLIPPVALCQDITIQLDSSGNASITAADIDNGSSDACGLEPLTVAPNTFNCTNVGPNNVLLTVTDVNGNVSSCSASVTVQDVTPPVALCQNITVYLDVMGNASITGTDIDNGSTDACGITSLTAIPYAFSCAEAGDNTVTLTVTDVNGNQETCTAIVTVKDSIPPVALCKDITAYLDVNGNLAIIPEDVDNGSGDACGITMSVIPSVFDCGSVGPNTVVLTVTDASGNISACVSIVDVKDNIPPQTLCQDITIYLDSTGNASIIPEDIDYGSNDACGIASYNVLPNEFTCINLGTNIVYLTTTDIFGNSSSCSAVVTVMDDIAPEIFCPENLSLVTLPGACDLSGVELGFATFTDNCVVSGIINDAPVVYPSDLLTLITWTITDGSGNSNTCMQTVYVESAPLAVTILYSRLKAFRLPSPYLIT
ncbi:MAG: HYR domain-containing protein, partial [Bacteroidales bacterium]|nr:HYR domain-containing protein [Bacteroidales bacterium]